MARSYKLLCPIARALDRIGDRWTMLLLRDLHAGPMRFNEMLDGLPGLASNLLASRLEALQAQGLVFHDEQLYELTALGRRTDAVLWELALLGMHMPPEPELKQPGHLRLAAVTLQNALRQFAPPELSLCAELVLDGESFTIQTTPSQPLTVRYGAPDSPDVVAETSYEPLMAAAAGEVPLQDFRAEHVQLEGDPEACRVLARLMGEMMVGAFLAVEG